MKFKTLLSQSGPEYNAFKRDIAVLNIFFGESTALGKSSENKKEIEVL